MKLWQVFVDNGQEYGDYVEWVDILPAPTEQEALAAAKENYKASSDTNIYKVEELKIDGYDIVLVKREED